MFNIIIHLIFLWSVFGGYFFLPGDSTIWTSPGSLLGGMHYYLSVIFIIIFIFNYFNQKIILKNNIIQIIFMILLIALLSTIINNAVIFTTLKFTLTIITPFLYYLYLVYNKNIKENQVKNYLNIYFITCIIQFFIALLSHNNIDKLFQSQFIIDDLFRGTIGAYQFVYLLNLYTIYIINKLIFFNKIKIYEFISASLFILSFIISGAGGYLTIFIISTFLYLLITLRITFKNNISIKMLIIIGIIIIFIYLFKYFYDNYELMKVILKNIDILSIQSNPKIIFIQQAIINLKKPIDYIFGLGPGQYLSGIGHNPNASYFGSTILEQTGSSFYGVNSDILIIFTEIGVTGLLLFCLLLISIVIDNDNKVKHLNNKVKVYKSTYYHSIIFSLLLSLQYRILFFWVSSYILMFFLGMMKRLSVEEEKKIVGVKNDKKLST